MQFNYETIKELAKQNGRRVTELIALAPQNDPFYVGTEGDRAWGEWFTAIWERFNYRGGVHLRRIHYQVISQEQPILLPNGEPYENTERCWGKLGIASKAARYMGLVDIEEFDDRRNPDPVNHFEEQDSEPDIYLNDGRWNAELRLPDFPATPRLTVEDYNGAQRYHLEVWCEKSTMNDILEPLCKTYGATLQVGVGELSTTRASHLVQRLQERARPARIFYVSDFDPAGKSMPVAVARKAEYLIYDRGLDLDVKLFPVVLTEQQVKRYRLPRTPIKDTERRKAHFEDTYGTGATELDALEALYPGELERILRKELDRYYDHALARRVAQERNAIGLYLDQLGAQVVQEYSEPLAALRAEYNALRQELSTRFASYNERQQELWQAISDQLVEIAPTIDQFPVPEADYAQERPDGVLFDTERDYLEQLEAYKKFQGKAA